MTKLASIIFYLFFCTSLLSQSVRVEYCTFSLPALDANTLSDGAMPQHMISELLATSRVKSKICQLNTLIYTDGVSSYLFDSLVITEELDFRWEHNSLDTYKDHNKDSIYQWHEYMKDGQIIGRGMLRPSDWVLVNESKTILGYMCRKAQRRDSEDIAWFTVDIPISEGPSIYAGGLPGLILEYSSATTKTVARRIELCENSELGRIEIPQYSETISIDHFRSIRK